MKEGKVEKKIVVIYRRKDHSHLHYYHLPAGGPEEGERRQAEDRGRDCCRGGTCSRVTIW